jgi:N6-adenosine-specific RNA methylase IME4
MRAKIHPYANAIPRMSDEEFADFRVDVRANGIRKKIVMLGDQILDGRHRYEAGVLEGLIPLEATLAPGTPEFGRLCIVFSPNFDGDPLGFVISENLKRRNLTTFQKAMAAAELETFRHGGSRSGQDANLRLDRADLAKAHGISERLITSAARVRDHGAPELQDAARRGQISGHAAEAIAELPKERQAHIIASLRGEDGKIKPEVKKALAPIIKEIRGDKLAEKRERRDSREKIWAAKVLAVPDQKFGVAIEDFEWDHEVWSRETGTERHASNHYPTSENAHTPEEIVARCAERFSCLAPDCILFKWVTVPHLWIGMQVLALQGFTYKTSLVWNKERPGKSHGTGKWFWGEHELVLVGVRGNVVVPDPIIFNSNFSAPVGQHSAKPPNIHEIVEAHWPNVPKIELNARSGRPGWVSWGYDAPVQESSGGGEVAPASAERPAGTGDPLAVQSSDCVTPAETIDDAGAAPVADDGRVRKDAGLAPGPLDEIAPDAVRGGCAGHTPMRQGTASTHPSPDQAPALCAGQLFEGDAAEWMALREVRAGLPISGELARHLVGEGYAHVSRTSIALTEAGDARLDELNTQRSVAA